VNENVLRGLANRLLQQLARILSGSRTLHVWLHRARGAAIGKNVWIGHDAILETSRPDLITIEGWMHGRVACHMTDRICSGVEFVRCTGLCV